MFLNMNYYLCYYYVGQNKLRRQRITQCPINNDFPIQLLLYTDNISKPSKTPCDYEVLNSVQQKIL